MGRKFISKLQNKTKNHLKWSAFSRYSTGDHTCRYTAFYIPGTVLYRYSSISATTVSHLEYYIQKTNVHFLHSPADKQYTVCVIVYTTNLPYGEEKYFNSN
jgi:hypothetical protein